VRTASIFVLASAFCCTLVAARVLYCGNPAYAFLVWNLVLAWVPLGVSLLLAGRPPGGRLGRPSTWALGALWLAFFPNAPYLLTDIIHLRPLGPLPIFDAIMLSTFGLTGMCMACCSLRLVHRLVAERRGRVQGWLFVGLVALLSGFGICLGRFRRWNSWDVFVRPMRLLSEILGWFLHPWPHVRTFAMTALMGGVILVGYLMFFALIPRGQTSGERGEQV
jgi:uncharacterized membrane protein